MIFARAVAGCVALCLAAVPARPQSQVPSQVPSQALVISGAAHRVLTSGLDTASAERVFCVHWHDIGVDTLSLDSAFVPRIDSADTFHVYYQQCPRQLATAHWHLLDLGAMDSRSPTDSATLVNYPAPFGILVMRRRKGDRVPLYRYYDR